MKSLKENGKVMTTPLLDVHYQAPVDSGFFRDAYTDAGY
jgi:hypothetical protein